MEYVLKSEPDPTPWRDHDFYTKAVVLGIDVGIEGIGLWLRRGRETLFAQTYLVTTPEAAPLSSRRAKRAWRRARASRRHRDRLFKAWITKFGLLSREDTEALWKNLQAFQTPFELRHRAIVEGKTLASPQALISCLRHLIKHRGYDYHMTEEGAFPWGDTLESAEIIKWAKHSWVAPDRVEEWIRLISEPGVYDKEQDREKVVAALREAAANSAKRSIEEVLRRHMAEKNHTNLRVRARNHNFPREQIKAHARQLLRQHYHLFPSQEKAEEAEVALLGKEDAKYDEHAIIDYHRRTPAEVKALWERKRAFCPYVKLLGLSPIKCSLNSELAIRQWKLVQFLAERTFVGSDHIKRHAPPELIKALVQYVADCHQAEQAGQPQPEMPDWKKELEASLPEVAPEPSKPTSRKPKAPKRVSLAKKNDQNSDYLKQLRDLLQPKRSVLKKTAELSEESAKHLLNLATDSGTCFVADRIRERLADYYQFRRNNESQAGIYPQVEFLLGNRKHYDDQGKSKDHGGAKGKRADGQPQQHGILRRLFANQLKDAHGRPVTLPPEVLQQGVPDYVVVEVVGDIPRNRDQKKDIEKEQREARERRDEVLKRYGNNLSSAQIRKVLLFDQQVDRESGHAICPFTGQDLGTVPLAHHLQVAHLFPEKAGGIYEMTNLCVTTARVNQAMGNRTPRMCAGQTIDGVTFLPWSEMEKRSRPFLWNKRKRELFAWKDVTQIPDWQNLTRQSQLARQLRREVIHWLGIHRQFDHLPENERSNAINNEITRRVGTPTGFQTSVCRQSWSESLPDFMREKKHRGNLRHHLYDAAVVAHIPPGVGLNSTACGGIFFREINEDGCLVVRALPGLLPDLQPFEASQQNRCLVHKPKQKKSKAKRTEETIYNLPEADPLKQGKLRSREPLVDAQISEKSKFQTAAQNVESLLKNSGIPISKLPPKRIEQWAASDGSTPLRLLDGTPVFRIPVEADQPHPTSLVPHKDRSGKVIGCKVFRECFYRHEIWRGEKNGRPDFFRLLLPHPRNLQAYQKRTGHPWEPEEKPPQGYEKFGHFQKDDLVLLPLDANGNYCKWGQEGTYHLWYRVGSLKQNLQITLILAEHEDHTTTCCPHLSHLAKKQPQAADVLAWILETTRRFLQTSRE
jgi:hypothetical protein